MGMLGARVCGCTGVLEDKNHLLNVWENTQPAKVFLKKMQTIHIIIPAKFPSEEKLTEVMNIAI